MIILLIGVGLLACSLLADVIGIGYKEGFGLRQTIGTIVGVLITAVGSFLTLKAKDRPNDQPDRDRT
ncbi:MAG: hypothetical protein ACR2MX_11655 [Cyclobacteriaceae bacterium]